MAMHINTPSLYTEPSPPPTPPENLPPPSTPIGWGELGPMPIYDNPDQD